ncbi:MAG TPA: 2-oxo acid dehydrogenase subunit E2, partial [Baekduia sp.]|nr:2-oxo acid dehydrogenase subunit E2 [Baekduia sp.]
PPAPAAPRAPAPPPRAEHRAAVERQASLRSAVGALMARSKREIPHYDVELTIDLSTALAWLAEHNASRPPADRVLPAALLLRAVALAARDVPEVNGTFADGAFHPAAGVTLGVAVSLRSGGIIAPAIPRADELSLGELMQELRGLTGRARRGVLRGTDLAEGATLTVTSLGEQGADLVHGVIFPPQVALIGFGRIAERPVAAHGMVGARPTVIATVAGDHRVSDGHLGSLFLAAVDHHLQEPDRL